MFGVWAKITIPLKWSILQSLTGLSFQCLRPDRQPDRSNVPFVNDERYTVAYIQREAYILLRFLSGKKHKGVGRPFSPISALDQRILRRWGLK